MSEQMEQVSSVSSRMNVLLNLAAKAWPSGVIVGFCVKCGKERSYDWEQVARMMSKGFPRCKCSGERIDLRSE